jgi:hypothetical protein
MHPHGLRVAFTDQYDHLGETLKIVTQTPRDFEWLLHRTPHGGIAVRLWPGNARITRIIEDALIIVLFDLEDSLSPAAPRRH